MANLSEEMMPYHTDDVGAHAMSLSSHSYAMLLSPTYVLVLLQVGTVLVGMMMHLSGLRSAVYTSHQTRACPAVYVCNKGLLVMFVRASYPAASAPVCQTHCLHTWHYIYGDNVLQQVYNLAMHACILLLAGELMYLYNRADNCHSQLYPIYVAVECVTRFIPLTTRLSLQWAT